MGRLDGMGRLDRMASSPAPQRRDLNSAIAKTIEPIEPIALAVQELALPVASAPAMEL
jgi:hypothetical protein